VPTKRIAKNLAKRPLLNTLLIFNMLKVKGKIKTSSTSKIKNTRHNRKNRTEKGRRALSLGVKPHSKGLNFS